MAQPDPASAPEPRQAAEPETPPDATRVTVLGYHDFSETLPETEMRIRTSKFRAQMAALRQTGATVISMADFLAWRKHGKAIPAESVLITIDDGWRSVYTDAFPILKEFDYPFTLFLYKAYINGGGKALTSDMIKEMMRHGATLGSHSVSHPYPSTYRAQQRRGERTFDAFLRKEFGESKRHIEAKFATSVATYAYPGGYVIPEMEPIIEEFGYQALFTIQPGRITRDTDDRRLPRFMILGTHDRIFTLATTFAPAGGGADPSNSPAVGAVAALPPPLPHPVFPESGAVIEDRLPVIHADLSREENLDPATLAMEVSGFGPVHAKFDDHTKVFAWKTTRRLRQPTCEVTITWQDRDGQTTPAPLRWQFRIDRTGAYLPATLADDATGEEPAAEGPGSITGADDSAPGNDNAPSGPPPAPRENSAGATPAAAAAHP
ncbi:MAG: polysaccharide deacetylase family protein [Akkermansiaceae bacterium]|nr:polysaccharide deacetylase family protein [Akkermansiaceae bacterium]